MADMNQPADADVQKFPRPPRTPQGLPQWKNQFVSVTNNLATGPRQRDMTQLMEVFYNECKSYQGSDPGMKQFKFYVEQITQFYSVDELSQKFVLIKGYQSDKVLQEMIFFTTLEKL